MSMVWFAISGFCGILALAAVSFARWRWWLRGVIAAVAAAALVLALAKLLIPQSLGPQDKWMFSSPIRELTLFVTMLVGMMARMLSLAIERRRSRQDLAADDGLDVDRWEFLYPMLFAVPTFGALLSQLQTESSAIVDLILAFQNGFFWQTVLKRGEKD